MKTRIAEKNSELLKQQLSKNPSSLVFSQLADTYRKEGDINQAVELCKYGIENHPGYITGRIILGRCYIELEDYEHAIEEFITVCRMDRHNQVAIKILADLFVKQGKLEIAGDLYRVLYRMDPFDQSFKILSARFDSTGKVGLFDILGIEPYMSTQLFSNDVPDITGIQQEQVSESFDSLSQDASEIDSGVSTMDDILETLSGDGQISSEDDHSLQVSGGDIDSRMEALFGQPDGEQQPQLNQGEVEHTEITVSKNETSETVSGSDISSRIDELFDLPDSSSPEELQNNEDNNADLADGLTYTASIEQQYEPSQIDEMVQPQENLFNMPANEPQDTENTESRDTSTDADNSVQGDVLNALDKQDVFTDEFEETIQFDRSVFSRLNDEPDYEDLVASSPFTSTNHDSDTPIGSDDGSILDNSSGLSGMGNDEIVMEEIADSNASVDSEQVDDRLDEIFSDRQVAFELPGQSDVSSGEFVGGTEAKEYPLQYLGDENEDTGDQGVTSADSEGIKNLSEGTFLDEQDDQMLLDDNIDVLSNSDSDNGIVQDNELVAPENIENRMNELFDMSDETSPVTGQTSSDLNEDGNEALEMYTDGSDTSSETSKPADIFGSAFLVVDENDGSVTNDSVLEAQVTDTNVIELSDERPIVPLFDEKELIQNVNVAEQFVNVDTGSVGEDDAFSVIDNVSTSTNESPDLLIDAIDNDVNFEHDATVVSDMDVLVIDSQDDQMTGDDVAGKIQEIFEESNTVDEFAGNRFGDGAIDIGDDAFGQRLSDTADYNVTQSGEQGALFNELSIVEEVISPTSVDQNIDTDTQDTTASNVDHSVTDSVDSGNDNLQKNVVQGDSVVSGSDIEERMDEFFGTDVLETVRRDLVPDDDEMEETIIQDFYTVTGENIATASGSENLEGVERVEIDNDAVFVEESSVTVEGNGSGVSADVEEIQHFSAASLFEEIHKEQNDVSLPKEKNESLESDGINYEVDQRDKPYEIPDHVLTPTLADIYYQQGQYSLAHQIYSRLLEKEPENDKLRNRLNEIQEEMKHEHRNDLQSRHLDPCDDSLSENNRVGLRRPEPSQNDTRPLAGVRIPKKKGARKKISKKKLS